jgi:hypothetical protein
MTLPARTILVKQPNPWRLQEQQTRGTVKRSEPVAPSSVAQRSLEVMPQDRPNASRRNLGSPRTITSKLSLKAPRGAKLAGDDVLRDDGMKVCWLAFSLDFAAAIARLSGTRDSVALTSGRGRTDKTIARTGD